MASKYIDKLKQELKQRKDDASHEALLYIRQLEQLLNARNNLIIEQEHIISSQKNKINKLQNPPKNSDRPPEIKMRDFDGNEF